MRFDKWFSILLALAFLVASGIYKEDRNALAICANVWLAAYLIIIAKPNKQ